MVNVGGTFNRALSLSTWRLLQKYASLSWLEWAISKVVELSMRYTEVHSNRARILSSIDVWLEDRLDM